MSRGTLNQPFRSSVRTFFRHWRCELVLVGLGLLASAPLLLFGFPHPTHDGTWHLRWWSNFSTQFWHGEIYPRWLPETNFGFGSPTFFYYPPLPYWISAVFAPVAGLAMPEWRALGWGVGLSVVLSGLATYWCLQKLVPTPRACVCAALYMVTPYHLAIDILDRGAYAESWAFVWMPFIVGGILEVRQKRSSALLKTTAGFALLFLTHLPTSVTFTPIALGLALCYGPRVLGLTLAALAAGVGLAAVYLVPSLTTQQSVSTQYLHFPYQTAFFFPTLELTKPLSVPDAFNVRVFWSFGLIALTFLSFYPLALAARQTRPVLTQTLPWLALTFCTLLLMLPITDPLYRFLPPLQMIQFPWRFLAPASLLVAVLIGLFWPDPTASTVRRLVHATVLLSTTTSIIILTWNAYSRTSLAPDLRYGVAPAKVDPAGADVTEYRPSHANLDMAQSVMGNSHFKVLDTATMILGLKWCPRLLRLEASAATNTQVLIGQFSYPGWAAFTSDAVPVSLATDPATGLLSLGIPPGSHEITIQLLPSPAEKLGWEVTAATAIICMGVFLRNRRSRQRHPSDPSRSSELHDNQPGAPHARISRAPSKATLSKGWHPITVPKL